MGKKIKNVKRESEVWEIVNRERKRKKRVNDSIDLEEWKDHFMRLLGGVESRVVRGTEEGKREGGEEADLDREEVKEEEKKESDKKTKRWKGMWRGWDSRRGLEIWRNRDGEMDMGLL